MKAYIEFVDMFIEVCGDKNKLSSILFVKEKGIDDYDNDSEVAKAKVQLEEYLAKQRTEFSLNLDIIATDFNKRVYDALQKVPYGQLASYKDIAMAVGSPKAYRAVGSANHKNEFVIVVPCHRIIGSNKNLVGFGPGLKYKEVLIDLEQCGGQNG